MEYYGLVADSSLTTVLHALKSFRVLVAVTNSLKTQTCKLYTSMPKCRAKRDSRQSFMQACNHNTVYGMGRWLASAIGIKRFAGCILQNCSDSATFHSKGVLAHVLQWGDGNDSISYFIQGTGLAGSPGLHKAIVLLEARKTCDDN